MNNETIPDAETVLPKNLCPLIKGTYGLRAISDKLSANQLLGHVAQRRPHRAYDDMVGKYKVDGVVEVVLQACHTFNIEAVRAARLSSWAGVPYMKLENRLLHQRCRPGGNPLGAFIEML